ncbi:uncharacterized protein Z518_03588 [Rhinocladiella mackenziei CBS 650.93]|uniref:Carboxylic ester hydrolase n=1 Tax=Rhinocladiella mackenziei CBS 650.93 TaxID=1442369 RepID=A0A0D2IR28_9EURO|nr:uncharacterized protein Z518_03588 [Rhinocladiella mackenziei CBS 650.93]KIX05616.1 hypothetical protein Z518_03588 [Rhinocladiella mackenziei CBS 650.93]
MTSFLPRRNNIYNYNVSLANLTAQGIATVSSVEQVGAIFSEDCLTLNVWVPSGGESGKAVTIWIYGGGYTSGSTQISLYDGQHLAGFEDVIVVSINYRVDILGFFGDPAAENRNPGFLDQRLGVEWIRDNIANFGGDPSHMILFGQSTGAGSVDAYSYAWATNPIVRGFIMQSGTAGFGRPLASDNAKAWYNVTATLGCGTNETSTEPAILSCVQSQEIGDLLAAMGSNSFGPTADNKTAFSDYPTLSRTGQFAQLPILTGNNDFEAGVFVTLGALDNITHNGTYWESFSNGSFAYPTGTRANASVLHDLPT